MAATDEQRLQPGLDFHELSRLRGLLQERRGSVEKMYHSENDVKPYKAVLAMLYDKVVGWLGETEKMSKLLEMPSSTHFEK
ncbi:MAG: hypothetical protein Q9201_000431, partial [Fulgogasparrea decipioides]